MGVANSGLLSPARQYHKAADSQFSNKWYYRQMQFSLNRFSVVSVYSLTAVLTNIDIYDMIYLLTAIGLSPGVSITVHIYTQTIHRTTQITTNLEECGRCPVFANFVEYFASLTGKIIDISRWCSTSIFSIKHPSRQGITSQQIFSLQFSGAFAKLRKATIIFIMSVCLSVRVEKLGSHWTNFH